MPQHRPLLNQVGFLDPQTPYLRNIVNQNEELFKLVFGQSLTIEFDLSQHFCIGWRDIKTGQRFGCPQQNKTDPKYEQCKDCMNKTGFNPAFYYSTELSTAQADYNAQAHIVYLAHFADNLIKVGITNAQRRWSRLLEQGARQAIILDTFPSANVARSYEADISKLGFTENLLLSRKLELIKQPYDIELAQQQLKQAQTKIETQLNTKFEQAEQLNLDPYYFQADFKTQELGRLINVTDQAKISGQVQGMLGSILLCSNQDRLLALPLKKFTGYFYDYRSDTEAIDTPAQQFSLF